MAEDKLYEEANEDLSDKVLDFGTGIAAAGVAAASFYRAGGVRAISKKLGEYTHSGLKKAVDDFQAIDYDHLNYRRLRDSYKSIKDEFKDFRTKPHDDRIRLEDRPGTVLEVISKAIKLRNAAPSIAETDRWQREVLQKIQKTASQNLNAALSSAGASKDQMKAAQIEMQKLVEHVARESKKGNDKLDAGRLRKRFKIGGSLKKEVGDDFYDTVIKEAQKYNEAFKKKGETLKNNRQGSNGKKLGKSIEEQLADFLEDVDNLARTGGTYKKGESFKRNVLSDHYVTISDVLNNQDKFNDVGASVFEGQRIKRLPIIKRLQELRVELEKKGDKDVLEKFDSIIVDKHFRKSASGEMYSLEPFYKTKHAIMEDAASSMPGKIFKMRDFLMADDAPAFYHFAKGTLNPTLAALEKGNDTKRIQSDYFYVAGKVFKYDEENNAIVKESIKEIDGGVLFSTRYGGFSNLYKDMNGLNPQRTQEDGSILKALGLNASTEMNPWEYVKNFFGERDNDYLPNLIKDIQSGKSIFNGRDVDQAYEAISDLNIFLNRSVRGLSLSALKAIEESGVLKTSERGISSSEILEILKLNDGDEIVNRVMDLAGYAEGSTSQFANHRLNRLVNKFVQDATKTRGSIELLEDMSGVWHNGSGGGLDYTGQFQRELSKELLIRLADENNGEQGMYTAIKAIIENSGMSYADEMATKKLAYTSFLDNNTHNVFTGFGKYHKSELEEGIEADAALEGKLPEQTKLAALINEYSNIVGGRILREGEQDAASVISGLVDDGHAWQKIHVKHRDYEDDIGAQYLESDFGIIRRSSDPMSMIRAINQSIQDASLDAVKDEGMNFINQLRAGGHDAGNISRLTMFPYFFLRRLGADDLPPFLRFSNEQLNSTWDLVKGLTKRIAPLAIGETYLEWADDTVGAVTGTRPSAGFINSLDYMDLGIRTSLDITGIGGIINDQSYVNPIMQYWGGRDGYYNADQERDHIANGYEAVRRGRYWDFGSVNEFRGSTIEYYQPTLTRRLNSDYYNKSLYSGYWDKWGHSLLPTPTAPLSPLVYLMDPYYLEEEHKDDRPYMVSGTMFAKETPWGIVLNPTIGELVKPVVKMNQDRMTDDGQDVKAIIYGINQQIRNKAQGDHAYAMVFDREQITAGEYTSYASPAMGEYSIRIGQTAGEANQDAKAAAVGGIELQRRTQLYDGTGGGDGSVNGANIGIGVSGIEGSGGNGYYPIDMLGQTNRRIYQAAARNANRGGILTTDYIHHSKVDEILDQEDMQDLINAGAGGDLVHEAAQSMRLIGGIYGYGANRAFGFGERDGKQIADAGDIDSFSRSFWDESLGGIGGGTAEIGRRFIPEYRRGIRVNPLLNTMPDWLPERLRFGDPYAQLPKGEARLPGKGYEALNELHPDSYGIYGSFDRYKILADVAPNSTEFKVWKKIANATVKDPALQAEMQKIQERVNEQNKQHDFYDYRIIGEDIKYQEAIVKEAYNDGTFRIMGSNDLYTIAGVDFAQKHTNPNDYQQKAANQTNGKAVMEEYLHAGMTVTLGIDANPYHQFNPDAVHSINAAVFVDGESIAQDMLEKHSDVVQRKKDNLNAADTFAMAGPFQRFMGGVAELVAHADLPLIHDRWLRVRSPLESYNAEQIYGTPYQTWSDVIGTYLMPAAERAVSDHWAVIRGTAEWFALNSLRSRAGIGKTQKMLLSGAGLLLDRGAFVGSTVAYILKPNNGEFFQKGGKIGLGMSILGNLYTSTQSSPLEAAASYAEVGWVVADALDAEKEKFAKELPGTIKKFFRNEASMAFRSKGAAIGAAAGFAMSGMIGPSALDNGGRDHWTPDRIKKKWELEDYFDRLTYIKYMGLYHKAAELAKSEEGTDVEKIFEDHEAWNEKRREIMQDSDVNNTEFFHVAKKQIQADLKNLREEILGPDDKNNHRFEYDNGFSINDLPGVRNGVFHSEEISEEERLYTLNALVTMGIKYNKQGTNRTQEDRDMTQLTEFERLYGTKIPDYYEVHHIVEFSQNGPDDPTNMIALHPDDHLYITEQQHKLAEGDFSAAQIGARTAMRIGEYGRAALLYKKAAESTMYGLRADARWTDVVKALPKYERDYFIEFMKEKDPDKQEEILQTVSPFLRRALKQVWNMDYESEKGPDNEEYFENHNLPNFKWEGWNPDSDLNKVKAKTIKNEGMLFSDFGIYESTYRDQEVINAPNLSPKGGDDPITVQANLQATLSGLGLTGVEVSVEPKSTKGIQSVINLTKVTTYKLGETVNSLFSD